MARTFAAHKLKIYRKDEGQDFAMVWTCVNGFAYKWCFVSTTLPSIFGISFLFDLILYIPVNNISVMSGRVFLG